MKFYNNGFIIQKVNETSNKPYKGIEADNWFFIYRNDKLKAFYDENIGDERSCTDDSYIECCNDKQFISDCIKYCANTDQKFRVLFCRTQLPTPEIGMIPNMRLKFLGYDYAYSGGSYYSCVQNDLFRNFPEFGQIQLNSNGLLKNRQQLERFIELRSTVPEKYPRGTFECGNFIAYMLYEAVNLQAFDK